MTTFSVRFLGCKVSHVDAHEIRDRLLAGGVVLSGDITLAVADIDLVYVGLRALISSIEAARGQGVALPR